MYLKKILGVPHSMQGLTFLISGMASISPAVEAQSFNCWTSREVPQVYNFMNYFPF